MAEKDYKQKTSLSFHLIINFIKFDMSQIADNLQAQMTKINYDFLSKSDRTKNICIKSNLYL